MSGPDPSVAEVQALVARHGGRGRRFEYGAGGLAMWRDHLDRAGFRALEARLSNRPLLVFDFNNGPDELCHNLHDRSGLRADYEGYRGPGGARVFKVDHHYAVPALGRASTTPMVLGWLLGLHDRGRTALLDEVAGARYLVNHYDVDITFAHHLASRARNRGYLTRVGPYLAEAALRNDHFEPPVVSGPATRALQAGLGMERELRAGALAFEEARRTWLPAIGRSLVGGPAPARVAGWIDGARRREAAELACLARWMAEGRITEHLDGRLVVLGAADGSISNGLLYLFLTTRHPSPVRRVQLLWYPAGEAGQVKYKLRAHGGLDLMPLYARLEARLPGSGFGGRITAGGSAITRPCLEVVRSVIEDHLAG